MINLFWKIGVTVNIVLFWFFMMKQESINKTLFFKLGKLKGKIINNDKAQKDLKKVIGIVIEFVTDHL